MDNDKNCNPAPQWYNTSLSPMDYKELQHELETLKAKVLRFLELDQQHYRDMTTAEEYTELCNLDYELKELCK